MRGPPPPPPPGDRAGRPAARHEAPTAGREICLASLKKRVFCASARRAGQDVDGAGDEDRGEDLCTYTYAFLVNRPREPTAGQAAGPYQGPMGLRTSHQTSRRHRRRPEGSADEHRAEVLRGSGPFWGRWCYDPLFEPCRTPPSQPGVLWGSSEAAKVQKPRFYGEVPLESPLGLRLACAPACAGPMPPPVLRSAVPQMWNRLLWPVRRR